jgi:DnaJ-class molecular chaperone
MTRTEYGDHGAGPPRCESCAGTGVRAAYFIALGRTFTIEWEERSCSACQGVGYTCGERKRKVTR